MKYVDCLDGVTLADLEEYHKLRNTLSPEEAAEALAEEIRYEEEFKIYQFEQFKKGA